MYLLNSSMKLNEVFDDKYYDQLQHDLKRHHKDDKEDRAHVSGADPRKASQETSIQDMIISRFEAGKLTYQQAERELKKHTPRDELFFWTHELHMAKELLDDE